jgi:hypothetical protein
VRHVAGVGTICFGAARRRSPSPSTPLRNVPPYPGVSILEPAKIPRPPKLKANDDEVTWANTLAATYRNVVRMVFGDTEVKYAFTRGDITRSKHFKLLVDASRFFIENDIAPVLWCLYSSGAWTGRGPAPIGWVFSTKIAQHIEPFKRAVGDGPGERLVFGEKHKELLKRYGDMRRDLSDLRPAAVREVIARHFPEGYEKALDAARQQADETQADIRARIAAGDVTFWMLERPCPRPRPTCQSAMAS